jgi:cytoskeleton-associated protein 5
MQLSNKQKRVEEEKALKTLKWNFDVPRKEFIEQLKTQMEQAAFSRTLMTQLFHDDFKYHITALQTLTKAIDDLSDATISNLDLLLRWLTLRFFETNPTVILKAIEYMQALFNMLANKSHHLLDYEATAFVPYFINKLGDPKDPIRKGFRTIIKQISQVYAPVKIFNFLVQGLVSKNSRQRAECLEELGQMIEALGLNPFNPAQTLKEIAKQIGDRDTSVRNAALNTITIAFQIAGEQVYKYIGKLNEKDQSMLDERIKRSSKSTAPGVKSSISGPISQSNSNPQIPNSNSYSTGLTNNINNNNKDKESAVNKDFPISSNSNSSINDSAMNGRPNTATITRTTPTKRTSQSSLNNSSSSSQPTQIQSQPKPRGEFSLDIKDDDEEKDPTIQIKLTPSNDLDELLNQPIGLPPRKVTSHYPVNILKETQDCKEAIDLVITHISHQKIDISFQNLIQIDFVIKDKEKRDLLIPHIDNLLNTCAIKLNVSHNVYLNSHDCQVDEVFKLFKGLFSVIIDIFDNNLGKHASIKTLKDLFYNLLSVMTDSKILNYPDGDQLIKAINIVTLKLLELSNQTTSYCALVKLLTECCDQENVSSKYLELVMKCIWRQIRRLSSQNAADQQIIAQIDTAKILNEINAFLKMYPSSSWQLKPSDLPLRTVKTLLFHLAKARQSSIIDDLNEIKASDDSEIKVYIMKLFRNGFHLTNANNSNIGGNNTNMSFGFNTSTTGNAKLKSSLISPEKNGSPILSRDASDQLSSIIKKIGQVETSKDGLRELYDFKQSHPDIDLNKYFKNSSGKLQSYIQENLKLIELENQKSTNIFDEYRSNNLSTNNRNLDDIMKTIADYKSRNNLNMDDDNDENTLKPGSSISASSFVSSTANRLLSQYQTNGSSRLNAFSGYSSNITNGSNGSNHNIMESENSIKAERYLDIVKDLKKKYTRSRTEVSNFFFYVCYWCKI